MVLFQDTQQRIYLLLFSLIERRGRRRLGLLIVTITPLFNLTASSLIGISRSISRIWKRIRVYRSHNIIFRISFLTSSRFIAVTFIINIG